MSHFNQNHVTLSREEIAHYIQNAKQGDQKAFERIYTEFLTPVYRYVFVRTNDKARTEDIVQTVFLKWYEALPRYELDISPLQYLFVIARRTIVDHARKEHISIVSLEDDYQEGIADDTDIIHDIDVAITTEEVMKHVSELSEREQEVLNLSFFAERTTEEIASILSLKEPHVRQIKKRALDRLKKLVSHLHDNS